MANTRKEILDALVTGLAAINGIRNVTRDLLPPSRARDLAPYVGVIATTEEMLVEDATHVRWGVEVNLILLVSGDDIEEMVDKIKDYVYNEPSIGALQVKMIGQEEVVLINEDQYSSARIVLDVTYVSVKGAF